MASHISIHIVADEFVFLAARSDKEKSVAHSSEDAFEYGGVRYQGFSTMRSLAGLKYLTFPEQMDIAIQPQIANGPTKGNLRLALFPAHTLDVWGAARAAPQVASNTSFRSDQALRTSSRIRRTPARGLERTGTERSVSNGSTRVRLA